MANKSIKQNVGWLCHVLSYFNGSINRTKEYKHWRIERCKINGFIKLKQYNLVYLTFFVILKGVKIIDFIMYNEGYTLVSPKDDCDIINHLWNICCSFMCSARTSEPLQQVRHRPFYFLATKQREREREIRKSKKKKSTKKKKCKTKKGRKRSEK